ncbi:MAG: hypothetical protein FWG11_00170 [Promicromonosporaceae bacterium]|nr:hypothetical protein [Promicromonosporaceae bacterium]
MRSGIFDAPPDARFLMLTLTAPSFGRTHRVPVDGGRVLLCGCGVCHGASDASLLGVPIDLDGYDYAGAVRWNYGSGVLFRSLVRSLRGRYETLRYVVVREWQSRGLLHLHALLRIDASEMPSSVVIEELARAISATTVDGRVIRFGRQVRAESIRADGNIAKAVWYLTKSVGYIVKDVADDATVVAAEAREHFRRMAAAARRRLLCERCPDDGRPCHRRPHRQWGARSHVVSQSRGKRAWSLTGLTRKAQREQRIEWAAANSKTNAPAGVGSAMLSERAGCLRDNRLPGPGSTCQPGHRPPR